jgi:hypothetical protein
MNEQKNFYLPTKKKKKKKKKAPVPQQHKNDEKPEIQLPAIPDH